MQMTDGMQDF